MSREFCFLPDVTPHRLIGMTVTSGPDQVMVDKATTMAKDLLVVVQGEWQKAKDVLDQGFQQQPPQQQGGYQQGGNYGQPTQQQNQPMYMGFNQQPQYPTQGYPVRSFPSHHVGSD